MTRVLIAIPDPPHSQAPWTRNISELQNNSALLGELAQCLLVRVSSSGPRGGARRKDASMTSPKISAGEIPHEIALQMAPVIRRIARHLARRLPRHLCIDDLVGAGFLGLIMAYRRFDPARGDSFQAYAELRIRGAMLDELRTYDVLSRDQRALAQRITAATHTLQSRLGRAPEDKEIAAELGMSLDAVWSAASTAARSSHVSLDGYRDSDVSLQIADPDATLADERLCRRQESDAARLAMESLTPRLRMVLELHYGKGLTLREIGVALGVTESRVCQLESEAIQKLRERCVAYTSADIVARVRTQGNPGLKRDGRHPSRWWSASQKPHDRERCTLDAGARELPMEG